MYTYTYGWLRDLEGFLMLISIFVCWVEKCDARVCIEEKVIPKCTIISYKCTLVIIPAHLDVV